MVFRQEFLSLVCYFKFIYKSIFIILQLVIYCIHINGRNFYTIQHHIIMFCEINSAISILF